MGTLQPPYHESAVLETLDMENHGRIVNSNFITMTRGGWNLLSDTNLNGVFGKKFNNNYKKYPYNHIKKITT